MASSTSPPGPIKQPAKSRPRSVSIADEPEPTGWFTAIVTYWVYSMALILGLIRDLLAQITGRSRFSRQLSNEEKSFHDGCPPLLSPMDSFYHRRLYYRYRDMWNRPLAGPASAMIDVIEREERPNSTKLHLTDRTRRCLNLGSYNYLGFSDDWQTTCKTEVMESLDEYGVSACSPRVAGGNLKIHDELEDYVAKFVGKEAAMVINMGYGTNVATIPALVGKGSLIVSDSLNHTSIVNGARASGAVVRVFKHNNVASLEKILRNAIVTGQPLTNRPWKKILVMVEGIYSMEGEVCKLAEIVQVVKKYRAYIYVDEAHSIGALGKTGRGVCEHTGVDPKDIDIMMGTFTKSFGAMGGYIAASKEVIDFLKSSSGGYLYANAMSPVVCGQILQAFRVINGDDGTTIGMEKLDRIKDNSNYFRDQLRAMDCEILGDDDSPVIPLMIYIPTKISLFSQLCFKENLAVVVVGFPAVPLNGSRARFCISAGHTREQLDDALEKIKRVVDKLKLRYERSTFG